MKRLLFICGCFLCIGVFLALNLKGLSAAAPGQTDLLGPGPELWPQLPLVRTDFAVAQLPKAPAFKSDKPAEPPAPAPRPPAPQTIQDQPKPAAASKTSGALVDVRTYGLTRADLEKAIAAVNKEGGCLYFSAGTWNINADVTIPANISMKIESGAKLIVAKGATLIVHGPFTDGLSQVFEDENDDPVKGVKFGQGSVAYVRPEWWGAKGNGDVNQAKKNSYAINRAMNSMQGGKGTLLLATGNYFIERTIFLKGSTYLEGQGFARDLKGGTVITLKNSSNTAMVEDQKQDAYGASGGIRGILFNGGIQTAPCLGIYFHSNTRQWRLKDCGFLNISGYAIYMKGIGRSHIENNYIEGCQNGMYLYCFDSWIQNNEIATQAGGVGMYLDGASGSVITGNIIFGDAGTISGIFTKNSSDTLIIGNRVDHCDYGILVYNGGGTIVGNLLRDHRKHGIFTNYSLDNALITDNRIAHNKGYGISIEKYCRNSVINNNMITNNVAGAINFKVAGVSNDYPLIEDNVGIDRQCDPPVLSVNSSTPLVTISKKWKTGNTSGTSITNFEGGDNGKEILVFFNDVYTTIKFNGSKLLIGHGGMDWKPAVGDHMRAVKVNNYWYCECFQNRP